MPVGLGLPEGSDNTDWRSGIGRGEKVLPRAGNQEMGFPWSSSELGNGFADCWALPEISGYKFALHVSL